MRRYPTNSPEARARIVVAVLMADGSLDVSEIDQMARKHLTEMIGVSGDRIVSDLTDSGGNLEFAYSLDVNTLLASENAVYINVREQA